MTAVHDATRRTQGLKATHDDAGLRQTLSFILPQPHEVRWQEIPWQTDLWAARRVAIQERKPIFAWMMNGSVLGCT
jgi:hypothetical protein